MQRAFERAGKSFDPASIESALHKLAHKTVDDVFTSVGRGELASRAVLAAVHPEAKDVEPGPAPKAEDGWFGLSEMTALQFRIPGEKADTFHAGEDAPKDGARAPVRGLDKAMPVRFSTDEPPIPGDRIVGIVTPGEGVTVYPIHAAALAKFENQPERWLDVRWDIDPSQAQLFEAKIRVTALNEPGSLATLATIIADHSGNIENLIMTRRGPDFHDLLIELQVSDVKHLHRIIAQLRASPVISSAARAEG